SGAMGISRIIWDADHSNTQVISHQLGNYNLIADGSTKLILEILSFDAPANAEINLEFQIYNGANTFAVQRKSILQPISKSEPLEFSFSNFIQGAGSVGVFDLQKVSAIELQIHGLDQDIDLQLASIKTDACPILPDTKNQVLDSCGICNGNNTSCLDCQGIINGKAKKDRCGVCNGNGASCLGCLVTNQSALLIKLDSGTLSQEKFIKQIANKILKLKTTAKLESYLSQQKKLANELHLLGWNVVWQLPIDVNACQNQIFCNQQSNQPLITEYQRISQELKKITDALITRYQKLNAVGDKTHLLLTKKSGEIYQDNLKNLSKVVASQSVCL
ncbi:MAG: hypothetical protein WD512_02710, partial [Candidatus Paceibacterota bacterium]